MREMNDHEAHSRDWRSRLRRGERVRVLGAPRFWAIFALLSLGSLFFLGILSALLVGPSHPMAPVTPSGRADLIAYGVFATWWLILTAWFWSGLLRAGVHLAESGVVYYDWLGRGHRFRYDSVAALMWGTYGDRPTARRRLSVCVDVEGVGLQWLNLRSENGWRVRLPKAVRDEIIERAKLRLLETASTWMPPLEELLWMAEGRSERDVPSRPWCDRW